MPRARTFLAATRPIDPRSRRVLAIVKDGHTTVLQLACGHSVFRHHPCEPKSAICDRCPNAGGLGGNALETRRPGPAASVRNFPHNPAGI